MTSPADADADAPIEELRFRPTLPAPAPAPRRPTPSSGGPGMANDQIANALQAAANQQAALAEARPRFHESSTVVVRSRRLSFVERVGLRLVVSVSLTLLVAGGSIVWHHFRPNQVQAARPQSWDPRVTDFVSFVEHERGLTFEYPIWVDFLPEEQFVTIFDPVELDDAQGGDEQTADAGADLADAVGLSTSYDPVDDDATLSKVSTLGFYSPAVDRIVIRGDELTPGVKSVLVHELTHALQHQHFTISMGGADDMEVRSVVEADAMRVENAYLTSLDGTDRDDAMAEVSSTPETDAALADVPWALVDRQQAPYVLGPIFLQHVFDSGGTSAIDKVFTDLPSSDELVEPLKYDDGGPDPAEVAVEAPVGAQVVDDPHQWSVYEALVMLDAWLPWRDSRTALDGWFTSGTVSYQRSDGTTCFSAAVEFEAPEQAEVYRAEVAAWALASGSATVPLVDGVRTTFEACPRPTGAPDTPTPSLMTSEALYLEHMVMDQLTPDAPSPGRPWYACVARALIDQPSFTDLAWTDTLTDEQQAAITVASDTAKWVCGPAPAA